jgi:hypothetical protein
MFLRWRRARDEQDPSNFSLGKLDTAAHGASPIAKPLADSNVTKSTMAAPANQYTALVNENSTDSKATSRAEKAQTKPVASDLVISRPQKSSAAPSTTKQTTDSNATSAFSELLGDDSDYILEYGHDNDAESKVTHLSDEAHVDFVPAGPLRNRYLRNYTAATSAENRARVQSATPTANDVPFDDSDWIFLDKDDMNSASKATLSFDEVRIDSLAAAPPGLYPLKYSATKSAEKQIVEKPSQGVLADDNSDNAILPASGQSITQTPDGLASEPLEFDDEEVPLREDADTFIITMQDYPSERNGTLKNEVAAAVRTPLVTASQAGEAAKRMAEDVLAPRTLKRAFDNMKGAITDEVVAYVNSVTAGYDVPEIAARLVEPIVNARDKLPCREATNKFVDKVIDEVQGLFGGRKRRRSMKQDVLDARNMAHMEDAHHVFAREMTAKAQRVLVADGICHKWQIMRDRVTLKWQHSLQQTLVSAFKCLDTEFRADRAAQVNFYLENKKNMQAEELMDAEPSWFVDKQNRCFTLKLFARWKVCDDPDVGSRNKFLATSFALPETFCRVSTASFYPEPSPATKKEDSIESEDGYEDGGFVWQDMNDDEQADEDEDDGVVWLHGENSDEEE